MPTRLFYHITMFPDHSGGNQGATHSPTNPFRGLRAPGLLLGARDGNMLLGHDILLSGTHNP